MGNTGGEASGAAPSAAPGGLRKTVGAGDLARAHRVVERARARPAGLALGVEAAASGQRVAATAGAAPSVRDTRERLALPGRERGEVEVGDVVHPVLLVLVGGVPGGEPERTADDVLAARVRGRRARGRDDVSARRTGTHRQAERAMQDHGPE